MEVARWVFPTPIDPVKSNPLPFVNGYCSTNFFAKIAADWRVRLEVGTEVLKFSNVQCWYRSGIPAACNRNCVRFACRHSHSTAKREPSRSTILMPLSAQMEHASLIKRLLLSFEDGCSVAPTKDFVL